MRAIRFLFAAGVIGMAGFLAAPAAGATTKPPNDLPAGAKVIGSLPFHDTENTSNATTDRLEVNLNQQCGAPVVHKGVWYKITVPASGPGVRVSAEGSSYSVGLMAVVKQSGSWAVLNCGPLFIYLGDGSTVVPPGGTMYILAFDDTPGSQGGTLRLSARAALPVPAVSVSINGKGVLQKGGSVRVRGTASCRGRESMLISVSVELNQVRKAGTLLGFQGLSLAVKCGNTPINWVFDVVPEVILPPDPTQPPLPPVPFVTGSARADVSAASVNADHFNFAEVHATIQVVR